MILGGSFWTLKNVNLNFFIQFKSQNIERKSWFLAWITDIFGPDPTHFKIQIQIRPLLKIRIRIWPIIRLRNPGLDASTTDVTRVTATARPGPAWSEMLSQEFSSTWNLHRIEKYLIKKLSQIFIQFSTISRGSWNEQNELNYQNNKKLN